MTFKRCYIFFKAAESGQDGLEIVGWDYDRSQLCAAGGIFLAPKAHLHSHGLKGGSIRQKEMHL